MIYWNDLQHPWSTEASNNLQKSKLVKCDWNPTITDGIVSNNTTDTDCSQMMVSIVKDVGLRGVLFLGDSTMDRLWNEVHDLQHINPVSSKKITKTQCRENWCTFCKFCNTFMVVPKSKEDILVPMDYGCIWGMKSVFENPLQETLAQYLEWHGKLYSLCIVNSGLHDQRHPLSTEGYIENVKGLLDIVFHVCSYIIWIETTAPLERTTGEYPQTVERTREWNVALNSYLETHMNRNVSVVQVFEKSLKAEHHDNVHMHRLWYLELARSLFEKIVNVA